MVELVYSAPKVKLWVDEVVDRNKAETKAGCISLVVDYAARHSWVEVGTPLFFAPEAEDGAGSIWKISGDYSTFDIASFFADLESILYKEIGRPGSEFNNIESYCKIFN